MVLQYKSFYRPGLIWDEETYKKYLSDFRALAQTCLGEIPDYQVMSASLNELKNYVIVASFNEAGKMVGFISAIILEVPHEKNVLHLGLTCVDPTVRGKSLTHTLTSKMILLFMKKHTYGRLFWVTNCACVLSSLANVAIHFENVFPSPVYFENPSASHRRIARFVSDHHRHTMYIHETAQFNEEKFVFEGSVNETVFEKEADDKRFHHRDKKMTEYYQSLLRFDRGDEILQVGQVSVLSYPKYLIKKLKTKKK